MKVAIHNNRSSFTKYWISYCDQQRIPYLLVDTFSSSILDDLEGCTHFFWHLSHESFNDQLISSAFINAIESKGIIAFPSSRHLWHFDDKIAQKYFFETHGFNHPETDVYFSLKSALSALSNKSYPLIMKLRRGSASSNVFLIKSPFQARLKVHKSFWRGFPLYNISSRYSDLLNKEPKLLKKILVLIKWVLRYLYPPKYSRLAPKERGYVMTQDFISNEGADIRVVVAGERAVALKRSVRSNDFRASGSGKISYPDENLDKEIVQTAFLIAERLGVGAIGIDFIQGKDGKNYVIEMSYGFPSENFLDGAAGSWSRALEFTREPIHIQDWIMQELLKKQSRPL